MLILYHEYEFNVFIYRHKILPNFETTHWLEFGYEKSYQLISIFEHMCIARRKNLVTA